MTRTGSLKRVLTSVLFYGALVLGTAPAILRATHGNDLWKALYSGRYLALFNKFPHHSTFTYSPVEDFLLRNAFNWFGNLILLGVHTLGDHVGLQALRFLTILAVVLLLHSLVRFETNPSYLVLFILFVFGINQKLILRTAFFSIPFTVLLFWFWHQVRWEGRTNWLYAIPILLLIWSNVHGSYIVGWGLLGILVAGSLLDGLILDRERITNGFLLRIVLVLVLTVPLVTFVKPFPETKLVDQFSSVGTRLVSGLSTTKQNSPNPEQNSPDEKRTSLVESVKSYFQTSLFAEKSFRSAEFRSPLSSTHFIFVKAAFVLLVITLAVLVLTKQSGTTDWLLFLVGAFFALSSLRTVAYLPLIVLPILLRRVQERPLYSFLGKPTSMLLSLVLLCGWMGISSAFLLTNNVSTLSGNSFHEVGIGMSSRYRTTLPEKILSEFPDRRVANSYNLGSYLIWRWWPYRKVLVDSKGSAYSDEFFEDLVEHSFRQNLLDKGITLYLTENTNYQVIETLESNKAWRVRLRDASTTLFEYQPERSSTPSSRESPLL